MRFVCHNSETTTPEAANYDAPSGAPQALKTPTVPALWWTYPAIEDPLPGGCTTRLVRQTWGIDTLAYEDDDRAGAKQIVESCVNESNVEVWMVVSGKERTDPDSAQVRYALELRPSTIC